MAVLILLIVLTLAAVAIAATCAMETILTGTEKPMAWTAAAGAVAMVALTVLHALEMAGVIR